jgi:glutamate/tyrosine decarboxylase-like PLP-dependent enzyme
MTDRERSEEPGLEPDDWEAFRSAAHNALDDAIAYVRSVRERPVWRPVPDAVKAALAEPLPTRGNGLAPVYREFVEEILPYPVGNIHPRFFGWVHGSGLPSGIVSEMMAAAMNVNAGGRDHAALYVERAVIEWCKTIFRFPRSASGILLSGTSMANLSGLAVARNARAGGDLRADGLQRYPRSLVAYASTEVHESVVRAMEILGLGSSALRRIPVDADGRIEVGALRTAISEDRREGREPFCVVATAGTVNTGAIDDLEAVAQVCREERLWYHVDGAFGALAVLSEENASKLKGLEHADSLAFDFHKWMHVPYDAGALLVRDGEHHRRTFSMRPAYLEGAGRGLAGGGVWPCDLGPELSRSFRALKIWFALKEHGADAFGRAIAMNCRQAASLAKTLLETRHVEVLNAPQLDIVCFRFRPPGWESEALDALNAGVALDLQESGIAAPSTTRVRGALAIRVNITNHRTRAEDLDLFVRAASEAAERRMKSG